MQINFALIGLNKLLCYSNVYEDNDTRCRYIANVYYRACLILYVGLSILSFEKFCLSMSVCFFFCLSSYSAL